MLGRLYLQSSITGKDDHIDVLQKKTSRFSPPLPTSHLPTFLPLPTTPTSMFSQAPISPENVTVRMLADWVVLSRRHKAGATFIPKARLLVRVLGHPPLRDDGVAYLRQFRQLPADGGAAKPPVAKHVVPLSIISWNIRASLNFHNVPECLPDKVQALLAVMRRSGAQLAVLQECPGEQGPLAWYSQELKRLLEGAPASTIEFKQARCPSGPGRAFLLRRR